MKTYSEYKEHQTNRKKKEESETTIKLNEEKLDKYKTKEIGSKIIKKASSIKQRIKRLIKDTFYR